MPVLTVQDLHRSYSAAGAPVPVLQGVTFEVPEGAMHAVMGPSGSGKSTLLRLLACLDSPAAGTVHVEGAVLPAPWSRAGDRYRNQRCGIVLQDHLLIEDATAVDNAALPLEHAQPRPPRRERHRRAAELLTRLGLGERLQHRIRDLSGGERQRVAIARAVIMEPALVLADEPTGALDEERTAEVMDLFRALTGPGRAVVVVTHDPAVAARCDHTWRLQRGVLS